MSPAVPGRCPDAEAPDAPEGRPAPEDAKEENERGLRRGALPAVRAGGLRLGVPGRGTGRGLAPRGTRGPAPRPRGRSTTPTTNVLAVAIENAWWIASTIAGMYGSTSARASAGSAARIAAPVSPTPVSPRATPAPPEPRTRPTSGGTPGRPSDDGTSFDERRREDRAGDRETHGPADRWKNDRLLTTPTPIWRDRDAVLDDLREHRERRPDAEPGHEHPRPQRSAAACRRGAGSASRAQPPSMTSAPNSSQPVPAGPRHDLPGGDRGEDQRRPAAAASGSRRPSPTRRRRPGASAAGTRPPRRTRTPRGRPTPTETVNARFRNRPERDDRLGRPRLDEHEGREDDASRRRSARRPSGRSSRPPACWSARRGSARARR